MNASSRIEDKRVIGICGNGTFTDIDPGATQECICCGKVFESWEIVVELFEYDVVCPDCILSGPKEMAQHIRDKRIPIATGWHIQYLMQIANILEGKDSITDFPGGIFAVKIAEAHREIQSGKAA